MAKKFSIIIKLEPVLYLSISILFYFILHFILEANIVPFPKYIYLTAILKIFILINQSTRQ